MAVRHWHPRQVVVFCIAILLTALASGVAAEAVSGSHTFYRTEVCDEVERTLALAGALNGCSFASNPPTKHVLVEERRPAADALKTGLTILAVTLPPLIILPVLWVWFGARRENGSRT